MVHGCLVIDNIWNTWNLGKAQMLRFSLALLIRWPLELENALGSFCTRLTLPIELSGNKLFYHVVNLDYPLKSNARSAFS